MKNLYFTHFNIVQQLIQMKYYVVLTKEIIKKKSEINYFTQYKSTINMTKHERNIKQHSSLISI